MWQVLKVFQDKLGWWKKQEMDLPHWSGACKIVLVIPQFSVATERLFSLLSNSLGDRKSSSMELGLCRNIGIT